MSGNGKRIAGFLLTMALWYSCVIGQEKGSHDYQYALIEAVKQKNLGNIAEAVKLYSLVVKEKPDCDAAHFELGTIYMMTERPKKAEESLRNAFSLKPENRWYTMAFLNILGVHEKYREMEKILREKIQQEPEEVEWEYQLANVYASKGKTRKAVRVLEDIEEDRGFSEKVTLLKASIYEREEKYEKALVEIEKVMRLFPEALQFRVVAAELSMKNGDAEEAAGYYREILELDSMNIFALTNLTDFYRQKGAMKESFDYLARSFQSDMIDVKRKLAILSYYLSEKEFVREYPEELEKLIVEFTHSHPDQSDARLMATEFFIDRRDYGKAYDQLEHYLELSEGAYPVYMQAILLANAASRNSDLLYVTERAMESFPDSSDIRFFRAIAQYETGNYRQLIANLEPVAFEDFSSEDYASQSKMLLAEAYYRLEQYAVSDSLFELLIRQDPDNHMVLNNYSYYLAERGDKLEQAESWSRKTIENNPDNATFLDTYAWILFKKEEYTKAERYILEALEKGGENDPEVNEHAGDIQRALGSKDIAKSYYEKALILGGAKETLEEKIRDLE